MRTIALGWTMTATLMTGTAMGMMPMDSSSGLQPSSISADREEDPVPRGFAEILAHDPAGFELVRVAWRRNPDVQVAEARLLQARADVDAVRAATRPSLGLEIEGARNRASASDPTLIGRLGDVPRSSTRTGTSLVAELGIDVSGRRRLEREAANDRADAAAQDLAAIRHRWLTEMITAIVDVRAAEELVDVRRDESDLVSKRLSVLVARHAAGEIARDTVAVTEAERAQRSVALQAAEIRRHVALRSVASLAGLPLREVQARLAQSTVSRLSELPVDPASVHINEAVVTSLPGVFSSQRRLQAAEAERLASARAQFPTLRFDGVLGWVASGIGGLGNSDAAIGSLSGALQWLMFDGGESAAKTASASGRVAELRARYARSLNDALVGIETSHRELLARRDALFSARTALAASERRYRAGRARYRSGLEDFTSLVDLNLERLALKEREIVARQRALSASARLVQSLGGWTHAESSIEPMHRSS